MAQVGLQVAEALEYAHQQRILHRDVKPSNLMLDTKGTVWVMDFGLAKAGGDEDLTRAGDVVGTMRYMAPERFQGKADARSDVYSLGLTLFEMVALRPAFAFAEKAQLVQGILHREPPPLRKLEPRVPRDLETIILKASAKEPAHRYATAADMADDLRRFLADRPVRARRARIVERTWRWCRRNPLVATLAGTVAGLLVTVATVAALMAWSLRKEEGATRQQLQLTRQAEQEGKHRLFRTLVEEARASRLSGRMGRRFHSLEILDEAAAIAREMKLPAADFLELRNETIACLALLDLRVDKNSPRLPLLSNVDLNGVCDIYARGDRSGDISVRRVAGDVEICRIRSGLSFARVRFSPDGRYLAAWDLWGQHLKVWKLAGSKADALVDEPSECIDDFAPAGDRLAIGHSNGSIELVDLSSRRRRHWTVAPSFRFVAFHPRLARLAIAYRDKIQILDWQTGKIVGNFPVKDLDRWIAWHPDGKTLATTGMDQDIYLWDVASGTQTARLEGHKDIGQILGFDPSGDLVASISWDGTLRLWDSRTGRQLFVTQTVWHHFLHFSSDGRLLGPGLDLEGRKLKLWDVAVPCGYRTLVRDPVWGRENYVHLAINPENRVLVAGMPDGLGFWDLASGRPVKFLPIGKAESIRFEDSGDLLTSRADGVYRFSIRPDPTVSGALRIGVGQKLPLPGPAGYIAASPDGQIVAVARSWAGTLVWNRDGAPISLQQEDGRCVAVSPDKQWVATSSHLASLEARIWEAKTGRLIKSLPVGGISLVAFSPDGRWLATSGTGLRLWKVPSWEEGPSIGGGAFAFSHDGRVIAVETGSGSVRLVAPATGAEFARLEDPEQDRAVWLAFSPDGTRLVANGERQALHDWDLRAIGEQLSQRNLPWDLPLPPADERHNTELKRRPGSALAPLQMSVDPTVLPLMNVHRRAVRQEAEGRWDNAACLFYLAMELDPRSTQALNGLAWLRATCPDVRYRNPAEAVALAERAVALAPGDGNIWNTLGVAHYRAGNSAAAIKALGQSMKLSQGGNSLDWLFLALAHWKQGEKELARRWYACGVLWISRQGAPSEELLRFRTEAADLLGIVVPEGLPSVDDDVACDTFFLDLVPGVSWARHERALAHCARDRWDQAAADFADLLRAEPEKLDFWCEYASVLLLKGDHDGYRCLCQSVVKRFDASRDAVTLYLLARILALAAQDLVKPAEAVDRAKKALAAGAAKAWLRHTLAVALYRDGQLEQALEQAEKSLTDVSWRAQVVNWLLLAMIHEKLGHHRDARLWLDKALQWLDQPARKIHPETPFPLPSWVDWLEVELLRREAQALIRIKDPKKAERRSIVR